MLTRNNTPPMRRFVLLPLTGALALALAACGGAQNPPVAAAPTALVVAAPTTDAPAALAADTAVPEATSDGMPKLTKAVLTTGLDDQKHPVDETSTFKQNVEFYLQLTFEGRPKKGLVRADLMYQDEKALSTSVDLADLNSGVIVSIGQDTFTDFHFTQTKPFPIGDQYRIDTYLDDAKIGSYPFNIVAADGSTQSDVNQETATEPAAMAAPAANSDGAAKLTKAVLTTGLDDQKQPVDETSTFKQNAKIYLQLTFEGRPKTGLVRAELMYQDQKAADLSVNLGDVNGDVIASIGQDTFANFDFTQTRPFPISDQYRIDTYLDDAKIGSYPFDIVAADQST